MGAWPPLRGNCGNLPHAQPSASPPLLQVHITGLDIGIRVSADLAVAWNIGAHPTVLVHSVASPWWTVRTTHPVYPVGTESFT
ncbi:hypothetical protein [Rhodococcus sp. H29-C3]|uniref:hypothetical protein n=1 Tax=Rhodococcus sp. H29-C3 TaxID=3046307 RepID=UPI0024B8968F|nr:hypothetical protein [Rhodococcus sp. H29-C3]MDJ0359911.1 hypothetical protein [Rhodococcus sp. H29-C3]